MIIFFFFLHFIHFNLKFDDAGANYEVQVEAKLYWVHIKRFSVMPGGRFFLWAVQCVCVCHHRWFCVVLLRGLHTIHASLCCLCSTLSCW